MINRLLGDDLLDQSQIDSLMPYVVFAPWRNTPFTTNIIVVCHTAANLTLKKEERPFLKAHAIENEEGLNSDLKKVLFIYLLYQEGYPDSIYPDNKTTDLAELFDQLMMLSSTTISSKEIRLAVNRLGPEHKKFQDRVLEVNQWNIQILYKYWKNSL